ncbi:hypothetical protein H5410_030495 [Solanum commersonii]|uniref:Uncharacterized protein n=1 Tax=Solanum commersonii TaxID=4109 RepID=A0A9J5YGB8_SOLCO|nr:hypothetical protein H5410_030495 [Solanum commersonii]
MRKKTTENFREYSIRWREQAARVKPSMKESEMIDVFLQAQKPDYFHYLLSVVGKTFTEVIKIGEMVENGIKSEKIVSQAAMKATRHVIKNGSGNLGGKKMKEDVANVVSDTQKDCRNLKRNVEEMIQTKMIVVQNDDPPNVTKNPLPAHNDVHFIEIIRDEKEYDNSLNFQEKTIEIVEDFMKASMQSSGYGVKLGDWDTLFFSLIKSVWIVYFVIISTMQFFFFLF